MSKHNSLVDAMFRAEYCAAHAPNYFNRQRYLAHCVRLCEAVERRERRLLGTCSCSTCKNSLIASRYPELSK